MDRWADVLERHRWVASAVVLALTAGFLHLAASLEIDDVALNIFRTDEEDFAELEQLFEDFGADDRDVFVVLEREDWFTPAGSALLAAASSRLEEVDGVEEVLSLDGLFVIELRGPLPLPRTILPGPDGTPEAFERARADAAAHPLGVDQSVSVDGRTALLMVTLEEHLASTADIKVAVQAIRGVVGEVAADTGTVVRLTGVPTIRVQIMDVIYEEDTRLFLLALGLGLLVALVVFRRIGALLAAGSAAVAAAVWGVGSIAFSDGRMDLMKTALPSVVMIIALTDAVHLVMDARFQRAEGKDRVRAAGDAVRHLGAACLLTSVTTAIGFASLAVGSSHMIRSFGVATAVAVGMAFLTVLTVTPLATMMVRNLGPPGGGRGSLVRRVADWVYGPVDRHAGPVAWLSIALLLGLGALALQLEPDNRLTEVSPREDEAFQALMHLDETFGGSMFAGVVVEWDETLALESPEVVATIEACAEAVREAPAFAGALSLFDVLRILPGDLESRLALRARLPDALFAQFARPDLRRALVRTRMPDLPSHEAEDASRALETELAAIAARTEGVDVHFTGTTIVARRNIDVMILDFVTGLAVAAVVIFFVLTVALRSWRLGLISLVPNAFPIVFVAALLYVSGYTLQMHNAMSFTILLGIAVDDTIHLLSRFRRELDACGDVREAAHKAVLRVGAALFTTTAILAAGFGGMLTSEIPTNRVMGVVCLLGFVAALIGDLLLLPALLIRFVPSRK